MRAKHDEQKWKILHSLNDQQKKATITQYDRLIFRPPVSMKESEQFFFDFFLVLLLGVMFLKTTTTTTMKNFWSRKKKKLNDMLNNHEKKYFSFSLPLLLLLLLLIFFFQLPTCAIYILDFSHFRVAVVAMIWSWNARQVFCWDFRIHWTFQRSRKFFMIITPVIKAVTNEF